MNWKKGIGRAVFAISIAVSFLGVWLYIKVRDDVYLLDDIMVGCGIFALVWLIYFIERWIIRGFRDENKRRTQQMPTRKTNFFIKLAALVMFIIIVLVAILTLTGYNLADIQEALNNL